MGYPRRLLHEAEEVVVESRPHWSTLAGASAGLAASVGALVAVAAGDRPEWLVLAAASLTLVALTWFVVRYVRWATTRHVVTSHRLIARTGVLARRSTEVPLERVEAVSLDQTLLQRLGRTGDLVVEAAGERRRRLPAVARPTLVQHEITRLILRRGGRVG